MAPMESKHFPIFYSELSWSNVKQIPNIKKANDIMLICASCRYYQMKLIQVYYVTPV